ncbi:MAG: SusC/RagA family TonB-linked outer membrane protein [Paraprevotella sp.]|nr:SusC/RagA family TonB-linked outer membrane protein [Paraprevotella sp.]
MNTKIKCLMLFIVSLFSLTLSAQQRRISGNVSDDIEGVMMANVTERDKNNRIVSAAVTDMNGNFTMTIKDPKNYLEVSYVGFHKWREVIGNRTVFKIKLVDNSKQLATVNIVATKKKAANGLSIPEREMSVASQSFNMSEMEGLAFTSVDEALQGKIAGLDIVSNSGNLGSGTTMRLRGVSSINGNAQPLIVVDEHIYEIPEGYENTDFSQFDNEEQFSNLLNVNPEDIESIEVLKDASATAIWGSRGANGVIKIKIKRGARGKTRVDFSYRFKGTWQPEGMNLLNGDQYTMMLKEAYFNPKQDPNASLFPEISYDESPSNRAIYYNYNKNTDWVDAVKQFGQGHYYNLNVTGGGEKATFRISAGYDKEKGTVIKNTLDRFSTRLALDYWVSDRITFSSNFSMTYTDRLRDADNSTMNRAYQAMPNMTIWEYDNQGNPTGEYFNMFPREGAAPLTSSQLKDVYDNGNPVAFVNQAWRREKRYNLSPQFSLSYKLLGTEDDETRLNYTGDVFMNIYNNSDYAYTPAYLTRNKWNYTNSDGYQGITPAGNDEYKSFEFTTRHDLAFYPHFKNEDHAVSALARFEMTTGNSSSQGLWTKNLPLGITDPTVDSYLSRFTNSNAEWRRLSYSASVHYSYKSKYSADVTLRVDGSTAYGAGNKYGVFPGLSARYNISDEKWMKWSEKWLSMLAVKFGWGIVGNNVGSGNDQFNRYAMYGNYYGYAAISPQNLRLTDLRWEKTRQWNLGFELGLFQDVLKFNLDIYNRVTNDLVMDNIRIASSNGFSKLAKANVGQMENKGWELYVNTGKFAKVGKFHMTAYANVSQNFNTIQEMDASVLENMQEDFNYNQNEYLDKNKYLNRIQIGNALGSVYGFRYKGVYAYDYDHNGYTEESTKEYGETPFIDSSGRTIYPTARTAAENGQSNSTCPIARDANGNIIYDSKGNPLQMYYNYGGKNYKFSGGDAIYEDVNHDGQIDALDIVYLGNCLPKCQGGFGLNFTYSRWTLRTSFNYRIGNKIINMARMKAESMLGNTNQSIATTWRWRKNGDDTEIPRAMNSETAGGATYNSLISDRYIEDGDYLRLQYVQLQYSFDEKKLKKIGLNRLVLSASADNLWFWSKYTGTDPDVAPSSWGRAVDTSKTPRARSFTLHLSVGF